MAPTKEKYFIAWVPTGKVLDLAEEVKHKLHEKFGIKQALKSPSHVTVKMPFLWNERKEADLIGRLRVFFSSYRPFPIILKGFAHFRQRVIFIKVLPQSQLDAIQQELGQFARLKLKVETELSDQIFRPHMTVAYNDLKKRDFEACFGHVKTLKFNQLVQVENFALLKKRKGKWEVIASFPLGQPEKEGSD